MYGCSLIVFSYLRFVSALQMNGQGVFAMLTVKEMSKGLRGHSAEFADAITLWDV